MLKRNHKEQDVYVLEHAWSEAFEHLAVSVAQLTLDGRLLTANRQFCELIRRSKREVVQKHFKEFFLPEGLWPECEAGLDRLIAGEVSQYSTHLNAVRTDGNRSG